MTARWATGPLIGFDVETTGVDTEHDRIVTASAVIIDPREPQPTAMHWLVNPDVEIPAEATAVHGITTAMAREQGRPPAEVIDILTGELALAMHHGVPAVVYNASFDLSMLEAENRRHGLPTLAERLGGVVRNVIDPFVIDREVDKYRRGKRTLPVTCQHYRVPLTEAHTSSADALAAVQLAVVLAERYPAIGRLPLDDLHTAQITWHAERQADFAAYLTRKGEDASDVCGDWPLRLTPEGINL